CTTPFSRGTRLPTRAPAGKSRAARTPSDLLPARRGSSQPNASMSIIRPEATYRLRSSIRGQTVIHQSIFLALFVTRRKTDPPGAPCKRPLEHAAEPSKHLSHQAQQPPYEHWVCCSSPFREAASWKPRNRQGFPPRSAVG